MSNLENFVTNGRKIVAVAVNYKSVIQNLKIAAPKEPMIFGKATSSYLTKGKIKIPDCDRTNLEVELGVVIGRKCKEVSDCDAMKCVGGYCLALDMTAMGGLVEGRKKGMPWFMFKSFDTACPVSRFIPPGKIKDPHNLDLWCKVNGEMKQQDNTSGLIFNIPQLINYISQNITLEPCDLLLTGTPVGSCAVKSGDIIECGLSDIVNIQFHVE